MHDGLLRQSPHQLALSVHDISATPLWPCFLAEVVLLEDGKSVGKMNR